MTRKGGPRGPTDERIEEEPWQEDKTAESFQRAVDQALEVEYELDDDENEPDFIYGDIVHDTETDDPIALVVVNVPGIALEDWQFENGETLADRKDRYPDDDDVIVVVPLTSLEEYLPDWDERDVPIKMKQLVEDKVPFAPFPSIQLVRVEDSRLRE